MLGRFEQFCGAISSIHLSIQRIERAEMAKYGLKGPHAQCMLMMAQYPKGITAAELCEVCDKDKAAISRAISELELAGMVIRQDRDGKRYRSLLYLTEQGIVLADHIKQLVHMAVAQASQGYDVQTRDTFVGVLNLIAGNRQTICREGLQEGMKEESECP